MAEEKASKSLTINDILDELIKSRTANPGGDRQSPVASQRFQDGFKNIQSPANTQTRPQISSGPFSPLPQLKKEKNDGLNLPNIAGKIEQKQERIPSPAGFSGVADKIGAVPEPPKPIQKPLTGYQIYLRTMASDTAFIKEGRPVIGIAIEEQENNKNQNDGVSDDRRGLLRKFIYKFAWKKGETVEFGKRDGKALDQEKVEYHSIFKVVGSGMTTGIIITITVAVGIYFLLSFFVFNGNELPTPIASTAPTPTAIIEINELENIFAAIPKVFTDISTADGQTVSLLRSFISGVEMNEKELRRLYAIPEQKEGLFTGLLSILAVDYPIELESVIMPNYLALLYRQSEYFNGAERLSGENKLIFITEVTGIKPAKDIMTDWEKSLIESFSQIYNLDPIKKASPIFLDNSHGSLSIRYINLPYPDHSIDYAVITSLSGRHYLIIASSRETMYLIADRIIGIQ